MQTESMKKINAKDAKKGAQGQKALSAGKNLSLRIWENESPSAKVETSVRDYEVVGYVISGKAELQIEGHNLPLHPGDSWTVPQGVKHAYKILEAFTAVEAISPAAK